MRVHTGPSADILVEMHTDLLADMVAVVAVVYTAPLTDTAHMVLVFLAQKDSYS